MPQQEGFEPLVNDAIDKLINTSTAIQLRMGVKLAEENRIREAFTLLAEGPPPESSKGAKQRVVYLDFLQRVQKVVGPSMVVLCAVGLGSSAVASMKDRIRIGLPHAIKEREDAFKRDILDGLANTYSSKCKLSTLSSPYLELKIEALVQSTDQIGQGQGQTTAITGDVYQLTVEDARKVATSEHIAGPILLTDTYGGNTKSFITILISEELTKEFIIQRQRVM